MKNLALIVLAALAAAELATAADTDTNAPETGVAAPAAKAPPATNAPVTNAPATNAPAVAGTSDAADLTPTNAVRMNFHEAPLNTVLNYLSKRMGFAIDSEVDIHGTATIVSEQPVGTNEVIELLSAALAKNNYAVSRNGRILTITTADTAKTGPLTPVNHPESPAEIPINDQMATDVLPVHTLNPTQLKKDLDELVPPGATLDANEAGNALVMTGRQKDIHRFAEIIAALDSSSVSEVEVFVLKFADAKSVADELKEVFQSPDSNVSRADARTRFQGRGGGGFNPFGGGGGGNSSSDTSEKNASNKAVFTSDDQMNALIASAPPDYFPMISNVVDQLDQPTSDITMIKVFHLKYSDATEIANELASLFPDDTSTSSQNNRSMGTRFLPPWMQPQTPVNNKSARMTRQALVRAVPDPRTASVIVTTSRDQMQEIASMIDALDNNPAQVQHVHAYELRTADPVTVQAALTALFAGQNSKAPATTTTSALAQRVTTTAQQQTTQTTSGLGNSGSGGGGAGVP
ncbi:MAG: secretin N-terminal domain-containing protein [Limisphaerales bacterium]